jgi:hypothetical protein
MHVSVMLALLVANEVFLTRIIVGGSVSGQEGGLDPSKDGNVGWKFFLALTRGWMQVGMAGGYSESRWSALARATAWVRLSTWSLL